MENTKRKRPTPTERKQIHCKFTNDAFNWIEDKHWELRATKSNFVNMCVQFAMKNENDFAYFYNSKNQK